MDTYITYTSEGGFLNLIRFRIENNRIINQETIFKTNTASTMLSHYGGRIAFD